MRVTFRIIKSWNIHYFGHVDTCAHIYLDANNIQQGRFYNLGDIDDWYFIIWWSSTWLTLKVTLSNWVGSIRVFISSHHFLTIFSQCESQCEKNSVHIVTHNISDIGILLTIPSHFGKYFSRKKEFIRKENSSMEKTS